MKKRGKKEMIPSKNVPKPQRKWKELTKIKNKKDEISKSEKEKENFLLLDLPSRAPFFLLLLLNKKNKGKWS